MNINDNNPLQMLTAFALTFAGGMFAKTMLDLYIEWAAQRKISE